MIDLTPKEEKGPTPDDRMSKEEKEAFVDKIEEFEGPDRREKRSEDEKHSEDPGVSHS